MEELLDNNSSIEQIKQFIINDTDNNETGNFILLCKNGHLEFAKWLLSIKPDINISAHIEFAFRLACEEGHLKLAQWLCTLNKNYVIIIEEKENKIIEYYIIKKLIVNYMS